MAKRRGHHEGSITKRSDGRWMARVTLPDGSRRALYARTREEAARKLAQALQQVNTGGFVPRPGRRTVGDLLEAWLEAKRGRVRPSTFVSYSFVVRSYLLPQLGSVRLAALDSSAVERALSSMLASGLSPRTCSYALTLLRQACKAGVRWGWLSSNPAQLAEPPKGSRHVERRFLDEHEAKRLLAAAGESSLGPLFAFLLGTGARLGEALALTWEDVDLEGGTVRIAATMRLGEDGKLERGPTKTERSRRVIPLPRVAAEALREQRRRQAEARLRAGRLWRDLGYVFTTSVGTPLEPRNVRRVFKGVLRRAGLPESVRVHDLRHSTASLLLAQGTELRTVMELLGHSGIAVTANTYAHVLPALKRDAAAKLDAALGQS